MSEEANTSIIVFMVNGKQYTITNNRPVVIDYQKNTKTSDLIDADILYHYESKFEKKTIKLEVIDGELSHKIYKRTYSPRNNDTRKVGARVYGTLVKIYTT